MILNPYLSLRGGHYLHNSPTCGKEKIFITRF
jgi:hypothetical protein